MNKACYSIALLALLNVSQASAAESVAPVVDPPMVGTVVSKLLADAKPDDAGAALAKDFAPVQSPQDPYQKLKNIFKAVTAHGKADFEDRVLDKTYGQSVRVVVDYLHFPHQEKPIEDFLFLRYTFMKGGAGWLLTNFDLKTSPTFPPPGWTD